MTIEWGMRRKWQRVGVLMMAATVLVLAGCGGGSDEAPPATPVATIDNDRASARPTPTPIEITMADVVWTTAIDPETRAPDGEVTSYPSDAPVIIAAVHVGSVPAGAVLTATWSIDGAEVPDVTMQAATENSLDDGWATFQFTREEGHRFPLGELEIRVTAADGDEVTGSVEIVLP